MATKYTALSPNGNTVSYGVPYNTHTSLLNQTGTGNIVSTVYNNSVSGVWSRDPVTAGIYKFTLNTPVAKERFFMLGATHWMGSGTMTIPITNESAVIGNIIIYGNFQDPGTFTTIDSIFMDCKTGDFSSYVELGDLVKDFPFEFRVYTEDAI